MSLRRDIARGVVIWSVAVILTSCALLQPKREVAVEAPPSAEEKQALQRLAKAEQAYQAGNLEEAAQDYRELAMAFPRTPQAAKALLREGEIEYRMERYAEAVSWFQQVIDRFPSRPEANDARLWLLRCYVKLDRFNDAVETGRSLMSYLPDISQRAEPSAIVGDAQGA